MDVNHFFLTRFCIRVEHLRATGHGGFVFGRAPADPLTPRLLEKRTALLRILPAAALAAQSSQDFRWVIALDPALPVAWESRLRAATAAVGAERVVLHRVVPGENLTNLGWLAPYADPAAEGALTTLLDDDDGLPRDFVARVQAAGHPERPTMICSYDEIMWDMLPTRRGPYGRFGYRASGSLTLSRQFTTKFPSASGFSFCCPWRADLSVFGLTHVFVCGYGAPEVREAARRANPALYAQRAVPKYARLDEALARIGLACTDLVTVNLEGNQLLMGNHLANQQVQRGGTVTANVDPACSFPTIAVDFEHYAANRSLFSLTARDVLSGLRRVARGAWDFDHALPLVVRGVVVAQAVALFARRCWSLAISRGGRPQRAGARGSGGRAASAPKTAK